MPSLLTASGRTLNLRHQRSYGPTFEIEKLGGVLQQGLIAYITVGVDTTASFNPTEVRAQLGRGMQLLRDLDTASSAMAESHLPCLRRRGPLEQTSDGACSVLILDSNLLRPVREGCRAYSPVPRAIKLVS